MDFMWEKEAAMGLPMPDGLTVCEQHAFQAMAILYARYNSGGIPREKAANEKKQIKRALELAYHDDNFRDNLCYHHEKLMKMTETAKTDCRKNPAPENAIKLCDVLDGLDTNDVLRPVIRSESDFRCPVCERVFPEAQAAREPNYCESCGARLGWKV